MNLKSYTAMFSSHHIHKLVSMLFEQHYDNAPSSFYGWKKPIFKGELWKTFSKPVELLLNKKQTKKNKTPKPTKKWEMPQEFCTVLFCCKFIRCSEIVQCSRLHIKYKSTPHSLIKFNPYLYACILSNFRKYAWWMKTAWNTYLALQLGRILRKG